MSDDFSTDTIHELGDRVGLLCSKPDCRAPTKGPHSSADKATHLGRACHIRAASKGGPRYDDSQTPEQRSSIENGIWLCTTCGALVDADPARFPAELLHAWKTIAEHEARERMGRPAPALVTPPRPYGVALTLDYQNLIITMPLHRYALDVRIKNIGTKRIDDWYIEVEFPKRLVLEAATVIGTRVPCPNDDRMWLFRTPIGDATAGPARKPLRVGDEEAYTFPYQVDADIFLENHRTSQSLFEAMATARAFVDGELIAEVRRRVGDLQCF